MKPLLLSALMLPTLFGTVASTAEVIGLSRPVSESVKPDLLYWNFDGGTPGSSSPNPTADGSGNGFDGYLLPGASQSLPTYVEGKFGTAVFLEALSPKTLDPHVNWNAADAPGSDDTLLDLDGKNFTAGIWICLPPGQTEEEASFVLFERGRSAGESSHWSLVIGRGSTGIWTLRAHLPGAFKSVPIRDVLPDDGEWHHVGMSLEVVDGESRLSFWVDGVLLEGNAMVAAVITPAELKDRILTVGERNVSYHSSAMKVMVDDAFITSGVYQFEP